MKKGEYDCKKNNYWYNSNSDCSRVNMPKTCDKHHCEVCPTGATGTTGVTGATGSTGVTGVNSSGGSVTLSNGLGSIPNTSVSSSVTILKLS